MWGADGAADLGAPAPKFADDPLDVAAGIVGVHDAADDGDTVHAGAGEVSGIVDSDVAYGDDRSFELSTRAGYPSSPSGSRPESFVGVARNGPAPM